MRIYVAGASSEIERARRVMAALRAEGHEITFDWTIDFESNEGLSDVQRAAYADADFQGVFLARRVVLLVPVSPSVTQGAWWEGGVADALEIPIIASGRPEDRARNIFLSRALEVDTDEKAVELCRQDECCVGCRTRRASLSTTGDASQSSSAGSKAWRSVSRGSQAKLARLCTRRSSPRESRQGTLLA